MQAASAGPPRVGPNAPSAGDAQDRDLRRGVYAHVCDTRANDFYV